LASAGSDFLKFLTFFLHRNFLTFTSGPMHMKIISSLLISTTAAVSCLAAAPTFTIDASHPAGTVSPKLYGLMTEEINHSYDGGLYAELIQNRAFLDNATTPVHWSVVNNDGAEATIALDSTNSFNDKLTTSLRLTVTKAAINQPAGVANSGYWGIPVQPHTRYRATLLARSEAGFTGPVTLSIVGDDGHTVYATGKFSELTADWKKFELSLETGRVDPTSKAHFVITLDQPATVWLGMVSLFPPTWHDRPNGSRRDLMQMLVDLNPKFLRFPGGNYVEGDTVETRFDWKKTIGPIEERHGHQCPWGYRSTDGMGLLEFLEWCEDMKAEPVLAVYAGYSLRGAHINPGGDLEPFVQEALDEIEYVIGGPNTTWGARRALDGHPAPFKLNYVEIGNEDWFDKSKSYDERFAQFDDAIKVRYPQLKTISTIGNDQPETARVHSRKPAVTDEHYYRSVDTFLQMSPDYAKKYDRNGPDIFVGEWAAYETAFPPWDQRSHKEPPTPNLKAAIGDAVFMTAMERNSDLIKMQCYAPLLVNINPGARQWRPDLIGYDAISSYGSPSYYAIRIFSRNLGDEILGTASTETSVQGSATQDSKTGDIFLKLVNPGTNAVPLNIEIKGATALATEGTAITLAGDPDDTNSIEYPRKVIPVGTKVRGVKPVFNYTLPPFSIVVLILKAR
jgi:alpha-L-arabinofuranosidase